MVEACRVDNFYCVIEDIYEGCTRGEGGGEKIRIFQKINRTTPDKYAIICSEFGCNIIFEDNGRLKFLNILKYFNKIIEITNYVFG